jgi:hypothetical protein
MHEIGGFALGRISAPIVARRRRHAFMTDHLLNGRQVGAGLTLSRR